MPGKLSFLKKLGQILSAGLNAGAVFFPLLRPFLGAGKAAQYATTGYNDFTAIGNVVVGVETLLQGSGTGPQKLKAALPQIAGIVRTSEMISGHHPENEAEFIAGCEDLTNSVVRILNSLKADHLPSPAPAVTPGAAATPAVAKSA